MTNKSSQNFWITYQIVFNRLASWIPPGPEYLRIFIQIWDCYQTEARMDEPRMEIKQERKRLKKK